MPWQTQWDCCTDRWSFLPYPWLFSESTEQRNVFSFTPSLLSARATAAAGISAPRTARVKTLDKRLL